MKSIKVDHPASAHGFLVKDKKHSIVYSGDTKPCQRLIEEGQNPSFWICICAIAFSINSQINFDFMSAKF